MASNVALPLQSGHRKALMDVIDRLRSIGINQHVHLPEIVVCGDQSSGKSSVLQAISGMSFPTKDSLCTRFATELVLRHTETEAEESCRIKIIPGSDRSPEQRRRLETFQATQVPENNNIGPLVDMAMNFMGIGEHGQAFGSDVLRIEISGPNQPHLTIVDLPGLFRAGNKEQDSRDAKVVRQLVLGYMRNPRSVILAVVAASSNFVLQEVTALARKIDPNGARTLGLITKPDLLEVGSKSEKDYFELAQNKDDTVNLRLGWHVIRNRSFASRDSSNMERDNSERGFLSQGIWAKLHPSQKGSNALKTRLSEVLLAQILEQLPQVLREVEATLKDTAIDLQKLGHSRITIQEQRRYLLDASQRFSGLVEAAVSGIYRDRFFGNARVDEGYNKRLRAVIQNTMAEFAKTLRTNGQARKIVDEEFDEGDEEQEYETSTIISRKRYLEKVKELMRRTRGCELPGTYNPMIVGELFREQSRPWKALLEAYSQKVVQAANWMIDATLQHVFDKETKKGVWSMVIGERMTGLEAALSAKSAEILELLENAHPITYNHYLTDNAQKAQAERVTKAMESQLLEEVYRMGRSKNSVLFSANQVLAMVEEATEQEMETYASNSATDMMEAYYKVALKRTIDDFGTLAVEACLMSKLPSLLNPNTVFELDDDQIRSIAEESGDMIEERRRLAKKFEVLQTGLGELERLSRLHKRWTAADDTAIATSLELTRMTEMNELEEPAGSSSDSPSSEDVDSATTRETTPPPEEFGSSAEMSDTEEVDPVVRAEEEEIAKLEYRKIQKGGVLTAKRQRRLDGLLQNRVARESRG